MSKAEGTARRRPTEAQLRVLRLIARGYTTEEIAADLAISEHTVKSHVFSLFERLHVGKRAHAVWIACEEGWL